MGQSCTRSSSGVADGKGSGDHKLRKRKKSADDSHATGNSGHAHHHHNNKSEANSSSADRGNGSESPRTVSTIQALQHTMRPTVASVTGDQLHSRFRQFTAITPPGKATLSVASLKHMNSSFQILVAGEDKGIAVVNYETGHIIRRWVHAHEDDINVVTAPLSSGHFATCSRDKVVKLWNMERDEPQAEMHGHTLNVTTVDYHPDGALVASGSRDNTVRLWDAATSEELFCGNVKLNLVHFVRFMPHLSCIAQGGEDLTIRLWDIRGGPEAITCELESTIDKMDYYPTCCETVPGKPHSLLTGHNGVNSKGSYVNEWDLRMKKCLQTFSGHTSSVVGLSHGEPGTDNANFFFSASEDGNIIRWASGASGGGGSSERDVMEVTEGRMTGLVGEENGAIITTLRSGTIVVLRPEEDGEALLRYRYIGVTE